MTPLRTNLFILYGAAIGAGYALLVVMALHDKPVASFILTVILVVFFGLQGYGLARACELSNFRSILLLPLLPAVLVAGMVGIVAFILLILVMWPFLSMKQIQKERRFRRDMKSQGRLATLNDLRRRLDRGEGTLIEEWGAKGPYRIWWTEDDLFALGEPVSTQEDVIAIFQGQGKTAFNSRCRDEYLDEVKGRAMLLSISAHTGASGRLARMFPKARVAIAVGWPPRLSPPTAGRAIEAR